MKPKLPLVLGIVFTISAVAIGAGYYLLKPSGTDQKVPLSTITPVPTPTPTQAVQPGNQPNTPNPNNWLTYTNTQYGFALDYPPNYQALDDADNLYGWPKAVVLFYGGGQSYDLPVEVWDSQTEYQAKYPNATNLTVHQVGSKYVTLVNQNFEPMVDQIITTFREI